MDKICFLRVRNDYGLEHFSLGDLPSTRTDMDNWIRVRIKTVHCNNFEHSKFVDLWKSYE